MLEEEKTNYEVEEMLQTELRRPSSEPADMGSTLKQLEKKTLKNGMRHSVFWVKRNEKHDEAVHLRQDTSDHSEYRGGNQYTGQWNRNKKHGFGVAVTSTGEKYEGYWKNNKREGSGTLYVKRKGRFRKHYQGDFFQNKKHGMGTLFGENSKYEGNFKDDKRHGSGTCEYANGDIYEGEWRNDQRSGRGLMLLANGDRFEGTFRGDKKNGAGKYYYRDTRKMYEGEWIEDIAKCGVYSDLPAEFGGSAGAEKKLTLPELGLKNPDEVIHTSIGKMRAKRQREAPPLTADEVFSMQEMQQLKESFKAADKDSVGYITSSQFKRSLTGLGLVANETELDQLLVDLGCDPVNFPFAKITFDKYAQYLCLMRAE